MHKKPYGGGCTRHRAAATGNQLQESTSCQIAKCSYQAHPLHQIELRTDTMFAYAMNKVPVGFAAFTTDSDMG